jgi:hypothetical protein
MKPLTVRTLAASHRSAGRRRPVNAVTTIGKKNR